MSISEIPVAVNPSELERVLDGLRRLDAPNVSLAANPERLGGGFWAELWMLRLEARGPRLPERVVLRLAPDAQLAQRETIVQRGVAKQDYPTPAIVAFGPATETTRFWSVMEHAAGEPLLAGLSGISALARLPKLARSLPNQLAAAMAQLHALDPTPVAHELAELPGRNDGVEGLLEHYAQRVAEIDEPSLVLAVEALRSNAPAATRRVICHGDLHPFNVLQRDGCLTVLDWTAAQVADPAFDVAFTALLIANPPLGAPSAVLPAIRTAARALSHRFIRAYDKFVDAPVDDAQLKWHTQLHSVRILVDLAQWRAAGTIDQHRGHPWLSMEPALRNTVTVE